MVEPLPKQKKDEKSLKPRNSIKIKSSKNGTIESCYDGVNQCYRNVKKIQGHLAICDF